MQGRPASGEAAGTSPTQGAGAASRLSGAPPLVAQPLSPP